MSSPHAHAYEDAQPLQKRWVIGARAIALVIHLVAAWAMGWYKIPALRIPALEPNHAPFVVKQIEINPDSLKPQTVQDPVKNLPAAHPRRLRHRPHAGRQGAAAAAAAARDAHRARAEQGYRRDRPDPRRAH